jgi:hypothetical protein
MSFTGSAEPFSCFVLPFLALNTHVAEPQKPRCVLVLLAGNHTAEITGYALPYWT